MPAHRTKPQFCIVPDCGGRADVPGTARGYCIAHYNRVQKYGRCQAGLITVRCWRTATSHLGLCDDHTPAGIPA